MNVISLAGRKMLTSLSTGTVGREGYAKDTSFKENSPVHRLGVILRMAVVGRGDLGAVSHMERSAAMANLPLARVIN